MTEQQETTIEEAAKQYVNRQPFSEHLTKGDFNMKVFEVSNIMQEVINNPSKYGLQPINQWVSVKYMPPENSGLYFVYDGKDVGIARMSVLAFRTLTSNEVYQNVTHYQTIIKPQPPINERDEG